MDRGMEAARASYKGLRHEADGNNIFEMMPI